ncbi:hypothetical protein IV102_23355 [bacterium]|nr:hypothetical protein [bacterium]
MANQFFWTKLIIVVGLAWCLSQVGRAWRGPRTCPPVPLLKNLPRLPFESDLYPLLFVLLTLVGVTEKPVFSIVAWVMVVALSCVYDYTRLLPWFYQYSFMLGSMAVCNAGGATPLQQQEALNICRLVNVSIYFWSGLLKANRYFMQTGFVALVAPLLKNLPHGWRPIFRWGAYAVPFLEAGLGLGLLFPHYRPLSVLAAVGMHCFILVCFSSLGRSTHRTIWPWNITMMLTTIALFTACEGVSLADIAVGQGSAFHWLVLALFALLPTLGLFNRLENIFSHGYMTGRHVFGYLHFTRRFYGRLPSEIRAECVDTGLSFGQRYQLDLGQWYVKQLAMNPPQNEEMLKFVARDFLRYGPVYDDLSLTITGMPGILSASLPQKTYPWVALFPENRPGSGVRSRNRKLKAKDLQG